MEKEVIEQKKKRRGTFLGESMRQTKFCLPLLEEVLTYTNFKRIVELGTGRGVLSYYFKLFCDIRNADFFTFDIEKREDMPFLELIRKNFIKTDIFDICGWKRDIGEFMKESGITIIFADAGNENKECEVFAPYLKKNDIIITNRYEMNKTQFNPIFQDMWDGKLKVYQKIDTYAKYK